MRSINHICRHPNALFCAILHLNPKRNRSIMSSTIRCRQEDCYIGNVNLPGAPTGPLAGLTFVAKDSYDVASHPTSAGSPAWLTSHPPPTKTAPAILSLLDAGSSLLGKTIMDEMAYSLNGENVHYGTPTNSAAPGRIPGGSSSGSAAAVAAGDCEFSLGGDTGGSVRVPASFCGLYGIRPTHGRVSLEGSVALAPSFDTAGWFSRDADILKQVGKVLLQESSSTSHNNDKKRKLVKFTRWLVAKDAFELADRQVAQAIYEPVSSKLTEIASLFQSKEEERMVKPEEVEVGSIEGGLTGSEGWFDVFRICQAAEIWKQHGDWITTHQPSFGPGIKERFEMASKITPQQHALAIKRRAIITQHMDALLSSPSSSSSSPSGNTNNDNTSSNASILMVPTTPGPAPMLNTPPIDLDDYRGRMISLTCLAGLAGLPQVNIPIAKVDGCPVGLGLIGPRGSDEELLELTAKMSKMLDL